LAGPTPASPDATGQGRRKIELRVIGDAIGAPAWTW
jgi:hypothetical protein